MADLKFYSTANEHIGEAVDAEPDGSCTHPFLVPNSARTQCVLPGRIDIGKHCKQLCMMHPLLTLIRP